MKPWIQPKRPGECADTARIGKAAKVRPENIKIKVEVRKDETVHSQRSTGI